MTFCWYFAAKHFLVKPFFTDLLTKIVLTKVVLGLSDYSVFQERMIAYNVPDIVLGAWRMINSHNSCPQVLRV